MWPNQEQQLREAVDLVDLALPLAERLVWQLELLQATLISLAAIRYFTCSSPPSQTTEGLPGGPAL